MAAPAPKKRTIMLAVGAVVLFLVWGIWTWANWGDPGDGVNDSRETPVQPATLPSGETEALPAQPANNAAVDASGDAAEGDRTVTRQPTQP